MIPLLYKDRRTEGDTTLRQSQLVQLHLLHVIDEVCKQHGLTYWLAWGSCLGAMRHQGFIPWDDDLDVGMPMADYKRFVKLAPEVFPKDVYLQTPDRVPFTGIAFAKVRDAYSFYYESRPDVSTADPSGIYIDVFPFEDIPDIGHGPQSFFIKAIGSTWHRQRYFMNRAREGFLKAGLFALAALFCCMTNKLLQLLFSGLRLLLPCHRYNDAIIHGHVELFDKRWFASVRYVKFEDGEFPVPVGAEEYLSAFYHDWRQVPPPDKRPRHARVIDPFHAAIAPWSMEYRGR